MASPNKKLRDLLADCRAIVQRMRNQISTLEFDVLNADGTPLAVQPKKEHPEHYAEQALERLRGLGVVPDNPPFDPVEIDDEGDAIWVGPPRPQTAQERVQRVIGAIEARARKAAQGRRRKAAERTRKILAVFRITPQYCDWRQLPLKIDLLEGMCRYLEARGIRPVPKRETLRKMLNRVKRRST